MSASKIQTPFRKHFVIKNDEKGSNNPKLDSRATYDALKANREQFTDEANLREEFREHMKLVLSEEVSIQEKLLRIITLEKERFEGWLNTLKKPVGEDFKKEIYDLLHRVARGVLVSSVYREGGNLTDLENKYIKAYYDSLMTIRGLIEKKPVTTTPKFRTKKKKSDEIPDDLNGPSSDEETNDYTDEFKDL